MTWKQLIDDIELELSRSKPSGDTELEKDWLLQQLLIAKQTILPQYIYKNKDVPPICLTYIECQHVKEEADWEDGCPKRQYLEIPSDKKVLEMTDDYGCWAVTFPTGKQIDRRFNFTHATLTNNLPISNYMENLGWYRVGNKIYLTNGTKSANFPAFSNFTLHLVLVEDGTYAEMMSDDVAAPAEVVAMMKDIAYRRASIMLNGASDVNAQGLDNAKPVVG